MDWSALPDLCLGLILSKLSSSSFRDCVCFATTCRQWRSVAKQPNTPIHASLLMPYPTTGGYFCCKAYTAPAARVFHRASSEQLRLHLPEVAGFALFGSRFGWLVAFRPDPLQVTLFNPFSRSSIPLPDQDKEGFPIPEALRFRLPGPDMEFCFVNAVLTAAPGDPDCSVVIRCAPGRLASARPGRDAAWRRVNTNLPVGSSFVCLKRTLYCLLARNGGYTCASYDLSAAAAPKELAPPPPHQLLFHGVTSGTEMQMLVPVDNDWLNVTYHLVEVKGSVCLVMRFMTDLMCQVQIFKLDSSNQWIPVESLGNSCLIVYDMINMTSVDDDPNLIPGCIYYPLVHHGEIRDKKVIHRPSVATRTWTAPTFSRERVHDDDDTLSEFYPCILLSPYQSLAYCL